jgi:heat shock protein HslJ
MALRFSAREEMRAGAVLAAVAAALLGASSAQAQINNDPGMLRGNEAGGKSSAVPQQKEKQFPVGSSWAAISLNDKTYPIGPSRPYFTLDSQFQLRGFGGCNTFSATAYPLRSQGFAVSPFAMTRRSCGPQIDAAERAFMLALRMVQKWDLVKGQLVLQGMSGTIRADRSL